MYNVAPKRSAAQKAPCGTERVRRLPGVLKKPSGLMNASDPSSSLRYAAAKSMRKSASVVLLLAQSTGDEDDLVCLPT